MDPGPLENSVGLACVAAALAFALSTWEVGVLGHFYC